MLKNSNYKLTAIYRSVKLKKKTMKIILSHSHGFQGKEAEKLLKENKFDVTVILKEDGDPKVFCGCCKFSWDGLIEIKAFIATHTRITA